MRAWRALAAGFLAAGFLAAALARDAVTPTQAAVWREARWPFGLDPWPAGLSFRCTGGACAREIRVTLRPKLGFCNCVTGVADDDEIDRVSDLVALGDRYAPTRPGWPVAIGPFAGRARPYAYAARGSRRLFAVAIAASRGCDVLVVLVDGDEPIDAAATDEALRHLRSAPVLSWAIRSAAGG